MAFVGAYLLHLLGGGSAQQKHVEVALGAALLVGAAAMVFRYILDRRSGNQRTGTVHKVTVRPVPTILIGMIGGVIVGLTSVGSGSLMIVLLLFLYPLLSAGQLVGTDLTQAVPLTAAAALGALIFGTVQFGVTASLVVGSVPAVLIGSYLSSRAPDRYIRPIITFVIFASGLKYVGVGTTALGWILCVVALGGGAYWLARVRPWENGRPAASARRRRHRHPGPRPRSGPANGHPPDPPGSPPCPGPGNRAGSRPGSSGQGRTAPARAPPEQRRGFTTIPRQTDNHLCPEPGGRRPVRSVGLWAGAWGRTCATPPPGPAGAGRRAGPG